MKAVLVPAGSGIPEVPPVPEPACTRCGHDNPAGNRFCGRCGAGLPLGGAPAAAGRSAEPPSLVQGERRHATILFSDLSGYTAMSERLDPEEVEAVMRAIKDVAARVVEAHGGVVNQFIGDEVVALFGIPMAHGNDPLRAVAAALELHGQVRAVDAAWRERTHTELTMHSSVNTGLIVVLARDERDGRYSLTGDTVNTGARLMALAGRGELVVGVETHRQISDHYDCSALAPAALRGKAQAVLAFRVESERTARPAPLRPIIGRDAELSAMRALLRRVLATGRGAVVHVRGDAGLGKSRLCRELQSEAELRGVQLATGLALDFGVGRGRDALGALTAGLLGVPAAADASRRLAAAATRLPAGPAGAPPPMLPFVCDLLGLPVAQAARADFDALDARACAAGRREALLVLVEAACAEAPLLLLIEDLHWADGETLSAMAHVAERTASAPILLLTTSRQRGDPTLAAPPCWAAELAIDLAPLSPASGRALASGFVDSSQRFAELCVERAAGNPMFLEQLLLGAEESLAAAVPGSVQTSVLSRVDRLLERDRAAILAASVLGQQIDLPCWRHVLGDGDYDPRELLHSGLVVAREDGFLFGHALIQDGIYQSLLRPRRRVLHERAAQWWQQRDLLLHAQHLLRAESDAAASAFLAAARHLRAEHRYPQVRAACAAGRTAPGAAALQFDLLAEEAYAQQQDAAVPDSVETYRDALACATQPRQACQAWLGIAQAYRVVGPHADALAASDQAHELALAIGDPRLLAESHHMRGNLFFQQSKWSICRTEHDKAQALSRDAGDEEGQANALSGLGDAAYLQGHYPEAELSFRACLEIAARAGLLRIQAANMAMLACVAANAGPLDLALALGRRAVELANRIHHLRAALIGAHSIAMAALESGAFDEAEQFSRSSVRDAQRLGARPFESESLSLLARAVWHLGRTDEACVLLDQAYNLGTSAPAFCMPLVLGARLHIQCHRPGHAERVAESVGWLARGCPWFCAFEINRGLCLAAITRGSAEELAEALDHLDQLPAVDSVAVAALLRRGARLHLTLLRDGPNSVSAPQWQTFDHLAKTQGFAVMANQLRASP